MTLPASEAGALVTSKLAVYGDRPPNDIGAEPLAKPFPHVIPRKVAQSN
jgi:hypothetical protein